MKKIVFLQLFVFLFCLYAPIEGEENPLFSKIGIQSLKNKKGAPSFCLDDLDGRKVELKNLKGKVVLINFWATWCGPCKEEMPSMEALNLQFKGKDFIFLAISVDYAGLKHVKEFIGKHRYTFPVLFDPKSKVLDLYQIKGIPATFIIDKRGRMVGKALGPRNWKSPEVFSLIDQLLKEK